MNYEALLKKVEIYKEKFNVLTIGKTCFNRDIFAVEMIRKNNYPTAIFIASIHAREHITTDLVCKMIDESLFDEIKDFNVSFILMANPDGVELCHGGIETVAENEKKKMIEINNNNINFSMWKANGRGVDLNNNFDANWGTNVGTFKPASQGFAGKCVESEMETKAIVNYTKQIKPFFTVSYHSKGEEIYYNFFQNKKELERDRFIAERFAKSTGYVIKNPETSSSGGYKDFCVKHLKIPALTIEVGDDNLSHPIGRDHLEEIFNKNKNVAKDLEYAYNIFRKFEE